ncbi:hypothetical protein N7535_009210 [Penicillium sp. DV-2018c]|nr:hypothetical protein N7461_002888 [Penicillium sp. DV-2018c]KAJ5561013.1 hypothetical protein N7535_009210 [Penicillium sp. DV-2018c]
MFPASITARISACQYIEMSSQRMQFGWWTKANRLQDTSIFDRKGRRKNTWRLVHAQRHPSRASQ